MATTETHKALRNAIVDRYVLLNNEAIRSILDVAVLEDRIAAIGSGVAGTGGPGTGAEQVGEIGDTVDAVVALIASPDTGFRGITPTIVGLSTASMSLATGAEGTLTVYGTDFLPFPVVELDPATGVNTDVSESVVMINSGTFSITIPEELVAGTYAVYLNNPLDTTASAVTSTQTFVLTRT